MHIEYNNLGYVTSKSDAICNNKSDFIEQLYFGVNKYQEKYSIQKDNITWDYHRYNIFSLSSGSPLFYKLFEEVREVIRSFLVWKGIEPEQGWIESWVNNHEFSEVLGVHDHHFPFHGYVSVEPKTTKTVFLKDGLEWYSIYNEVGSIYFGPGNRLHKVVNLEPYDGKRITLGLDYFQLPHVADHCYLENGCISFIPITF